MRLISIPTPNDFHCRLPSVVLPRMKQLVREIITSCEISKFDCHDDPKIAVITGGNSGIGLATAVEFVAKGGSGMTQIGRAQAELNIEITCTNSGQAKGRVERADRTLQDRLVKELRLADICTAEARNAFLPEFRVGSKSAYFDRTSSTAYSRMPEFH
jgi:hypothetical protein